MELKRSVLLCLIVLVIMYGVLITRTRIQLEEFQPVDVGQIFEASDEHFVIKTPNCFIPMMEAYGPTVKRYVHVSNKKSNCFKYNFITYRDKYRIVVNKTAISKNKKIDFQNCKYIPFSKRGSSDKSFRTWPKKARNFTVSINATDPFVLVQCYLKNQSLFERQAYAFIFRNKTLDKIMEKRFKQSNTKRRPMNILLLGFESTSRLNFIRHMNWTYSFLMKDLQAVEMLGYNKIGLNTFPNMFPVLVGLTGEELNYKRGYLDKYPFVWKNLSAAGYRTFMSEDDCGIATFQYLKKGFAAPPVDHYWRTYMLTREGYNRHGQCSGNKLIIEVIIDDTMEFVEVYKDVPHFAFTFISRPTHDNVNGLGIEDLPYYRMLKTLKKKKLLENTMLIVMGDHGIRYGSLRNTFQGRLEENLPALFISLPEWFRKEQKLLFENIKLNSRKLINNFDIYATFMDIIDIGKGKLNHTYTGKHGKSLLRQIPTNRTCADIGIPPNFCACSSYEKANINDTMVKNASIFVVSKINNLLRNVSDVCTKLNLQRIVRAQKSSVSQKLMAERHAKIKDYVVAVKVKPSDGLFEAGVRYDFHTKKFMLLGAVSRVNKYAGQSDCLKNRTNTLVTERYCFCKDKLKQ